MGIKKKMTWFDYLLILIFLVILLMTFYPFLNVLAISLNDSLETIKNINIIIPNKPTMANYNYVFRDSGLVNAALLSVARTVIGAFISVMATSMLAYTLSRKEFIARRLFTIIFVITMYVGGGIIPDYLLIIQTLGLKNTFWAYIIPSLFQCFNMIVIRTYISNSIPDALVESGRIDGAGDLRCFFQIILPLCLPVLATIALFIAVGAWNDWFSTWLYNSSKADLHTLQYLLKMKLATTQNQANAAMTSADALAAKASKVAPITVRASITVVSALPIMVVYPFLQKYFVTGMALGAVKG